VLIVAQGALGYTQYFNGVPPLLVGFHVAGATAVFTATMAVLLAMYEPIRRRTGLADDGAATDGGDGGEALTPDAAADLLPESAPNVTGAVIPSV
jgi:hypothetical protein